VGFVALTAVQYSLLYVFWQGIVFVVSGAMTFSDKPPMLYVAERFCLDWTMNTVSPEGDPALVVLGLTCLKRNRDLGE
jgi:hypothetical protein